MPFPRQDPTRPCPRVVITGAGILTSLGNGWALNSQGFRTGRNALRPIALFDVSRQRTKRGGEAELPADLPDTRLTPRQRARLDRATIMVLHAAAEALAQAGWGDAERTAAVPVSLGTSAGAMALGENYYRRTSARPSGRAGLATLIHHYQPQRQASLVTEAFRLRGPAIMISNACASGANAIGHAMHLVRSRQAERVLAGGYDALAQMVFAGFDSLQALSPTIPRPFDANRDGLALGEGAAVLTLESLETARHRGAPILAEAAGYGAANDTYHLTQPHPDGEAALASMTMACRDAGLGPRDIGYINAHGTGTPLNDSAEANAIARWAGDHVSRVAVSSTKGSIGHLLGGAGAVEAVISLMALSGQWIPPVTTVEHVDPGIRFDLVRQPRAAELNAVLTNSFGFGGANATLVLKRFHE